MAEYGRLAAHADLSLNQTAPALRRIRRSGVGAVERRGSIRNSQYRLTVKNLVIINNDEVGARSLPQPPMVSGIPYREIAGRNPGSRAYRSAMRWGTRPKALVSSGGALAIALGSTE